MRRVGGSGNAAGMPRPFRTRLRQSAFVAALFTLSGTAATQPGPTVETLLRDIRWGEPQSALLAHFGARAIVLRRPIDFGDSYAQIVLRDVIVGGVPLIAFFQIDKATGGLKRIQLERQRHGVSPAAFRALIGAFEAGYGAPFAMCSIPPEQRNGYQAATEFDWSRDGNRIRLVYRDTTIEAFEGCLWGDITMGSCGLKGQLLVRISPPGADAMTCSAPRRRN